MPSQTTVTPRTPKAKAEAKAAAKPDPKPAPDFVHFESRKPEPTMFSVAGYRSIRNHSTGHLEWVVPADDVARFEKHHHVVQGRIMRRRGVHDPV